MFLPTPTQRFIFPNSQREVSKSPNPKNIYGRRKQRLTILACSLFQKTILPSNVSSAREIINLAKHHNSISHEDFYHVTKTYFHAGHRFGGRRSFWPSIRSRRPARQRRQRSFGD